MVKGSVLYTVPFSNLKENLFIYLVVIESTFRIWRILHSVQFSHSVVSDPLWPHELEHARPSCPTPTLGAHPNSCPLNQWCHPIISSSVIPFSCPQSFPASGSFQMSQLFASGSQIMHYSFLKLVINYLQVFSLFCQILTMWSHWRV